MCCGNVETSFDSEERGKGLGIDVGGGGGVVCARASLFVFRVVCIYFNFDLQANRY